MPDMYVSLIYFGKIINQNVMTAILLLLTAIIIDLFVYLFNYLFIYLFIYLLTLFLVDTVKISLKY